MCLPMINALSFIQKICSFFQLFSVHYCRDYMSQAIGVGLNICSDALTPTLSKLIGFSSTLLILFCNLTNVKWAVKLQVGFVKVVVRFAVRVMSLRHSLSIFMHVFMLMKN